MVSHGRVLDLAPPRSLSELYTLFERGIGLVIRSPERKSQKLRALSHAVGRSLPGEQRIHVFATAQGAPGLG